MKNKDEQSRNTYRKVKIFVKDNDNAVAKTKRSVSFDTVPQIVGESSVQKEKIGLQLPIPLQVQYYSRFNDIDKIFYIGKNGKYIRRDYPSRPTVLADSLVISKEFGTWHENWHAKLSKIQNVLRIEKDGQPVKPWNNPNFKYPNILFPREPHHPFICNDDLEPYSKDERRKLTVVNKKIKYINEPRTILIHITGRRHTWVALDWLLCSNFIHDCDHLVIMTNLPAFRHSKRTEEQRYKGKQQNMDDFINDDPYREQWGHHQMYPKELINEVCNDIIAYINVLFDKNPSNLQKSLKVTIDMTIGKTKQAFIDAINIYQPNLIFISTLKWERYDRLITKKSNYLKDVLAINCSMPVIVLPVKRMWKFELSLENYGKLSEYQQSSQHKENIKTSVEVKDTTGLEKLKKNEPSNVSVDSLNTGIDPFPKKKNINEHVHDYLKNLVNQFTADHDKKQNMNVNDGMKDTNYDDNDYTSENMAKLFEQLPTITQIYLTAKKYRFLMKNELSRLHEAKNEDGIIEKELDIIIKNSVLGSIKIDKITEKEQKIRDDLKDGPNGAGIVEKLIMSDANKKHGSAKIEKFIPGHQTPTEGNFYDDEEDSDDEGATFDSKSMEDDKNGFLQLRRVITGGTPVFISSQIANIQDASRDVPAKRGSYPRPLSEVYKDTHVVNTPPNITFLPDLKVKQNNHTLGNQSRHSNRSPSRKSISGDGYLKTPYRNSSDMSSTSQKSIKSDILRSNAKDSQKSKSRSLPSSRRNSDSKETVKEKPKSSMKKLGRLLGFK